MFNAAKSPKYVTVHEFKTMLNSLIDRWSAEQNHNGLWHIEDISVAVQIMLENMERTLEALDGVGLKYEDNGDRKPQF